MSVPTISDCLRTPNEWPLWPFLPVKRRGERGMECGIVFFPKRNLVFKVSVYALSEVVDLTKVENYTYVSPEAMETDGWLVD